MHINTAPEENLISIPPPLFIYLFGKYDMVNRRRDVPGTVILITKIQSCIMTLH